MPSVSEGTRSERLASSSWRAILSGADCFECRSLSQGLDPLVERLGESGSCNDALDGLWLRWFLSTGFLNQQVTVDEY